MEEKERVVKAWSIKEPRGEPTDPPWVKEGQIRTGRIAGARFTTVHSPFLIAKIGSVAVALPEGYTWNYLPPRVQRCADGLYRVSPPHLSVGQMVEMPMGTSQDDPRRFLSHVGDGGIDGFLIHLMLPEVDGYFRWLDGKDDPKHPELRRRVAFCSAPGFFSWTDRYIQQLMEWGTLCLDVEFKVKRVVRHFIPQDPFFPADEFPNGKTDPPQWWGYLKLNRTQKFPDQRLVFIDRDALKKGYRLPAKSRFWGIGSEQDMTVASVPFVFDPERDHPNFDPKEWPERARG